MALPVITSRTQVQAVDLEVVKSGRVTNAVTGLYTVPTGKVAICTSITGLQDALGTDATAAIGIEFAGGFIPLSEFVAVAVGANFVKWEGRMLLAAGDVVTEEGDSGGTNHTWDMTCSIKEFNA